MATKDPMAGYRLIESAQQQINKANAEPVITEFEVLDFEKGTKEVIDVAKTTRKKRVAKRAVVATTSVAAAIGDDQPPAETTETVDVATANPKVIAAPPRALQKLSFVTPYMEIGIMAIDVHVDSGVFAVLVPNDSQVKVQPKRGVELEVVWQGETLSLYSSGVYVPISLLEATLCLFFVKPEEEQC